MSVRARSWVTVALALLVSGGRAAESALFDPPVSAQVKDARLSVVLRQFTRDSGILFEQPALTWLDQRLAAAKADDNSTKELLAGLEAMREHVDPPVTLNVFQQPLGLVLAQIETQKPVMFERFGGSYQVTSLQKAPLVASIPHRKTGAYDLRLIGVRINHVFDLVWGPLPSQTRQDDLTVELAIDSPSALDDAAIGGLSTDLDVTADDQPLKVRAAPGLTRSVIQTTAVPDSGRAFVLPFALPANDVKSLTQLSGTLLVLDGLREAVASFGVPAADTQVQNLGRCRVSLSNVTSGPTGIHAEAVVSVPLNDVARSQLSALAQPDGTLLLPWQQPAAPPVGRRRLRSPADQPVPLWLLPAFALEAPDGRRVFASSRAAARGLVLRKEVLEGRYEMTWPTGTKAARLLVGVLDPGPSVSELPFVFTSQTLPTFDTPPAPAPTGK